LAGELDLIHEKASAQAADAKGPAGP